MNYRSNVLMVVCTVLCWGGIAVAQPVTWDTVSTGCLRLVVGSNGEMGHNGIGKANMDYVAFGSDCDTTATVYLKSGGPFVIRRDDSNYQYWSALWDNVSHRFTVTSPMTSFSTSEYTSVSTGMLLSGDSSITVKVTYYAPTAGGDSCKFIIQRIDIANGPSAHNFPNWIVGVWLDWNVPSDPLAINSVIGLPQKGLNFQAGVGSATSGCQSNSRRIAVACNLSSGSSGTCGKNLMGNGPVLVADSLRKYDSLSGNEEGRRLWSLLSSPGVSSPGGHNFVSSLAVGYGSWPLTTYSALITIQDGDTAELTAVVDAARKWHADHLRPGCSHLVSACCLENSANGRTGNVDCDTLKGVDISDLARLIDYMFMGGPELCCTLGADLVPESDSAVIDIADLADLIDFLYIRFSPTSMCR